jgi:hypothetical protein
MRFFDDLVVMFATCLMRGVMAVGTGFAYAQMLVLAVVVAMIGSVGLAVAVTVVKGLLLG